MAEASPADPSKIRLRSSASCRLRVRLSVKVSASASGLVLVLALVVALALVFVFIGEQMMGTVQGDGGNEKKKEAHKKTCSLSVSSQIGCVSVVRNGNALKTEFRV